MLQCEIADCLTRIRNAYAVGKKQTVVRKTKLNLAVLSVMKQQGSIKDYAEGGSENPYLMTVDLAYAQGRPSMKSVSVYSRPGYRRYDKASGIPTFKSGLSYGVITTSKGVMTTHEAKELNLGGEILCVVE